VEVSLLRRRKKKMAVIEEQKKKKKAIGEPQLPSPLSVSTRQGWRGSLDGFRACRQQQQQ